MSQRLPSGILVFGILTLLLASICSLPQIAAAQPAASATITQRWIVQLAEPPLAQAPVSSEYTIMSQDAAAQSNRLQLESQAAQQYRAFLQQRQATVFQAIQQQFAAAQMHRSYQIVFNGMSVALPDVADATAEAQLEATPGVMQVYREQAHELNMYASLPLINAPMLWEHPAIGGQANAGQGIKVAVIDTGIKIDHPFFDPAGYTYPTGFPKGETAHTTPKVIAARAYFRPDIAPLPGSETPQPGPADSSHGTHVAGTVAGNANTTATAHGISQGISGVAPRAYLMNYKTFYENDSVFAGMAFETELMAAIEDAVADGADVISNSWGGRDSINPRFSPLAVTANAAADAGVPVVFSAGNAGPSKSTADSGDINNKLIMVGASTAAQTFAAGFVDVIAPEGVPAAAQELPYGAADFGQPIMRDIFGPAAYVPVDVVAGATLACDPLPADSLTGKIALIERGICHFSAKVYHAQQAGAIGAIVYNSEEGGDTIITMGGADYAEEVKIPSVFIERSAGMAMIDWYHQHGEAVLVQIDPTPRIIDITPDVVAPFSSRGPTFQHNLKPDVVAPGVNILSAGFANAEGIEAHLGFGVSSGTSMAAPHVSGAVALLKQAHPEWSPIDIKAALMTTANTELWRDVDRTEAAGVLDRGAGRIDLGRAVNPGLLLNPPSLSFGNKTPVRGQPTRAETTVQARNISAATQTYTIQGRQTGSAAFTVSVSPPSLTLAPGETGVFNVAIELPPDAPAGDYEGIVELQGPTNLHLPIWTRALPAERGAKVLLLDNDGSSSIELYNYADYYVNLLEELNVDYTYLDIDARAGEQQTLPDVTELLKHEIILWFTGDNNVPDGSFSVPTPLTELDQNVLIAYLQGGGNLIATGQNLAQASDIEPVPDDPQYGRSDLYHYFLASRFIQENVFGEQEGQLPAVTGIGRETWLEGISLDLTAPAANGLTPSAQTSAGNQDSVDEVKVIDMDPRMPDEYTFPILETSNPGVQMEGYVALHRYSFPTLEEPEPAFTYRTTYLSFGLEGVRSDTSSISRKEFLQKLLFWHVDYPGVDLQSPVVTTEPNQAVQLTANAHSNIPTTFVRYRWDFGDGSPYVETQEPTVEHRYAQPGTYPVRVEVTDSWGHRAVSGVLNLGERKPVPYTPNNASQSLESTGPQQPAIAPQTAPADGAQSIEQPAEHPAVSAAGTLLEGFVENVQSTVEHMRQQVKNSGE